MAFFWGPSVIETATVTVVARTTETLLSVNSPHNNGTSMWADSTASIPLSQQMVHLAMILAIPIIWLLALIRKDQLEDQERDTWLTHRTFQEAWRTKDWGTLYGLMGLANDHKWTWQSPFCGSPKVHNAWNEPGRFYCKRLLAFGIIPLLVQDGGIATTRVPGTEWAWDKRFPYFRVPKYQQVKSRAHMEFAIPLPEPMDPRLEEFLEAVVLNRSNAQRTLESQRWSLGVVCRYPDEPVHHSTVNPPEPKGTPLQVGAKSYIEPLLPFKKDVNLKEGEGRHRCSELLKYMRDRNPGSVPLLEMSYHVLVRIEARHFEPQRLDEFLYTLAQGANLQVKWPEIQCRDAALEELERLDLPVNGLLPFRLSAPPRFH
jgi:hypothetical protein